MIESFEGPKRSEVDGVKSARLKCISLFTSFCYAGPFSRIFFFFFKVFNGKKKLFL